MGEEEEAMGTEEGTNTGGGLKMDDEVGMTIPLEEDCR